MKISVICGQLLILITFYLSSEVTAISNTNRIDSNTELNELLKGKKYKKHLKRPKSPRKSLPKKADPENKGITTTKPKTKRRKKLPSEGSLDLSLLNELINGGGLKKHKKSKKKPGTKKVTTDKTKENDSLNNNFNLSDSLNYILNSNGPTNADSTNPVPEQPKDHFDELTESQERAIDGLNDYLMADAPPVKPKVERKPKKHGYDVLLDLINKGENKLTKSIRRKRSTEGTSLLEIKDLGKLGGDDFSLEDALGSLDPPADPPEKQPKGKPIGSDLMDLIISTPQKKFKPGSRDKNDPKGTPTEPTEPKREEPKTDPNPQPNPELKPAKKPAEKTVEFPKPTPKKKSDKSTELNDLLYPGPLSDLRGKFKTVTDGISGALKKPGAMDKLMDTLGIGDKKDTPKDDSGKKPEEKPSDPPKKTDDKPSEDTTQKTPEKTPEADADKDKGEKAVKGTTKIEDINPTHKTEYREKLVDSSFDKDFKQYMGDAEFGSAINYYKGHEVSGDRTQGTKSVQFYNPRDPAEDWNNSGLAASLRYLGSGYDIVFGNPLGDPVVMMDQGYRNPVIKLNWDVEYLNSDGANLKEPHGSWVRPEFSCRQSETIDHINSVEDFKKELSVDAQASYGIPYFFSFSGSTGYKNFVKSTATNKVRTYITKTYCLRYVAGIVNYHALETTEEFQKAVAELPNYFDSQACTLELFKSNEDDPMCVNSVKPWVKFIKMFGTHFTTIVHLGGKITHQVQINKSDVLNMQQHGVNVDVAVKAAISPTLLDNLNVGAKTESDSARRSESEHFKYEKQVLVIGGDGLVDSKDLNSLNCWTKDLYKKPMPIKVKLESLKSLLSSDRQRESFEEALKFYSETYGVSPDEIYKKYGRQFGIASLVQKGHQIVYSGNKSGSAVCPNKTVIIMGFTMTILKKKNFIGKNEFVISITHCPVGEEKCLVSNDNQTAESRIWAVCGEDTIPLLNQQTSVKLDEPATATCPPGYSIAYGFAFSIPKGNKTSSSDSYPCRSGTASCTHESTDKSATNAVWIACVENGAPQLTDISNHMVSTSSRNCSSKAKENDYNDNVCPTNSKLIAGWSMDFSESDQSFNQINKCSKNTPGCKVDKKMITESQCRSHYSWISCLHESAAKA